MLKSKMKISGTWIAIFVLILIPSIVYGDKFFGATNVFNVLRQMSMIGLISISMTCVILTAGIDLSVGATVALAAVISAKLTGQSIFLAILVPILVGVLIGMVNGFVITKLKIVPFIATLAVQMAVRGIAYIVTDLKSISVSKEAPNFSILGRGYFYGVPIPVIILAVMLIIMGFVCRKTSFGRSLYAIGGNEDAARMMGIKVARNKALAYVLNGAFSALAGVILCSRLGAGQPVSGSGWEMDAVAAVAIGGTLLSGGVGGVGKTLAGVLITALIGNIINLQGNINTYVQQIIMGVIVLVVIIIQRRTQAKEG